MLFTVFYQEMCECGFVDTAEKEFDNLNEAVGFCNEKRTEGQTKEECKVYGKNIGEAGYGFMLY